MGRWMAMRAAVVAVLLLAMRCVAALPPATDVDVHVQRNGDIWIADFDFARSAPVWAFAQSGLARRTKQPWRLAQWTVLTPGVLLQRTGHVDTLSMADGTSAVPPQVRLVLRPSGGALLAANEPALVFTEGGADLMAWRAMQQLQVPGVDVAAGLRAEVAECAALSKPKQALATARQRQSWRAPYACGLVLGLVAEGVLRRTRPDADYFDFIGPLIAQQRSVGSIGGADWRDALLRVSGDAQLVDDIRRFTDDGVADPKAFIDGLLQRAGVRL